MSDTSPRHDDAQRTYIALGNPLPFPVPFGICFNMSGTVGPLIINACHNPTSWEIHGARKGRIRLGLVEAGKHTLFILLQQPEMLKGWADMPYCWSLVRPEQRYLARDGYDGDKDRMRYLFAMLVCDQHCVVHAIRGVTVSPRFTLALDDALLRQQANLGEFSPAAHDAEIAAAYRRWPTSDAMLSAATIVETAGSDDF